MLKPQLAKTHCPHGHPYSGDNLIIMVVRDNGIDTGKRKRQCRACKRLSHKAIDHSKPGSPAEKRPHAHGG
jgi:hypothetical protein